MSNSCIQRVFSKLKRRLAPAPVGQADANWYDQLYSSVAVYHCPYYESHYYFLWAVIADLLRRAGTRRVLEIGCGPGQLAALLVQQGVQEYVGLDFSPAAIDLARKNVPQGRFVVGDARCPDIFRGTNYDALICTEVLEHIEDDLQVVSQFGVGKRCLCSVPNFPYDGHVRHFQDAPEVTARYSRFFDGFDVATFASPRSAEDRFHLFDGVRNDFRVRA